MTSSTPPGEPTYADRTYRSTPATVAGALLLLLIAWLLGDALISGEGRAPWLALAGAVLVAPLVVAFTLRPAVLAGARRILIRNPFRTIVLPWSRMADVRAAYSTELFTTDGKKYQVWALPVSLRDRKRAVRQSSAARREGAEARKQVRPAVADQAVADLRKLAEEDAATGGAAGAQEVTASVRWAWEIIGPAVAGGIALVVLFATT
ncbi:PH domain-containing protein [Streptomyces sp. NBC_01335]|uniref:PH domain-containing protein n=1 Tax=Streptomyces sp. NBC_01335 TaxID=2903828 RepID=UPI002E12449E|nr:PH domain-containing protein [Streptomyces sp. NBC_01335]